MSSNNYTPCRRCRFWKRIGTMMHVGEVGECRINPPLLGDGKWPRTKSEDFCGQWQDKDEKKDE